MTKNNKKNAMPKKKKSLKVVMKQKPKKKSINFGPLTTVNTAPVAIGNSVRGSKSNVLQTGGGVTVSGRDFMFPATGTGTITTWTLCGGTPLVPAAFSDSTVRQYMQMYQKFRWLKIMVHYITSSPTSANGDVLFYHQKNRSSVFLNQTSSQLLPFVMSDEDTVIGPQWTNHSVDLHIKGTWKSTDYGMSSVVDDFADGEIFLLSKTSTTDSPGYVIFDYVLQFAELQISPRLLALPLPRIQWTQLNIGQTTTSVGTSTTIQPSVTGNNLSGGTSALPAGAANGDIYKVILDYTNSAPSSWVNGSPITGGVRNLENGGYTTINFQDGTTMFANYNGSFFTLYSSVETAVTGGAGFEFGGTSTITYNLQIWVSLVTTISNTNINPNF
jgi:hypothetical protein